MEPAGGRDMLVIAAPEHDAAAYHLTGFLAPDPVIFFRVGGRGHLAVSAMEYPRARREARVEEVLSFDELGVEELARELRDGHRAYAAAAARALLERSAKSVAVPPGLGVAYADELRARGVELSPDGPLFSRMRRRKTEREISCIERTQRAVEEACQRALGILREAGVGEGGALSWRGEPLTSERLRSEIDVELLRRGCAAEGTIVAGGPQAADPHERGSGPLRAGETIIVDVFPRDQRTRYYADMTRTFVKGEPDGKLVRMHEAVLEAQRAALGMIRAGVNGRDVHRKVSEVLHEAGYKTALHDRREGRPLTEGFMHGTGHGVGLEIHEAPRISTADEELLAGDVVTVEPGVYDPEVGGVRIEDLVVVTEEGCRNLTRFPKELVVP
ncbi:peptidase M24 [Rubrobacter xylanophilus DSM 9941]|uniref:Peptidase M24 n=1 Tax=Rubrobacter xylanophilus (strain DSM 9941 / JCM 11954 / NBRC 16129 / PRD-1) TaxID=266117 RepID=Q1AS54_RUBXD|nr:Xaa-Pro peptidase family protein [Rubrobacter xylanophilus]ABG05774.1 peptidase M24 [Rubrobacter xylanophilus DSM 9941]